MSIVKGADETVQEFVAEGVHLVVAQHVRGHGHKELADIGIRVWIKAGVQGEADDWFTVVVYRSVYIHDFDDRGIGSEFFTHTFAGSFVTHFGNAVGELGLGCGGRSYMHVK
jgi:hypothetical protein